jgi:uncharacterized protein (DUF1800 family)
MPSRRDVLLSALAAALVHPSGPASGAPSRAAAPDPGDLWLNRLTFGATPAERAAFAALGPQGWLDDQLSRPAHDAEIDARLGSIRLRISYPAGDDGDGGTWAETDELRPLSYLTADPSVLAALVDWSRPMDYTERARPADEVIAAALTRAVHAPAQLREVMTQFWHDHFNVHAHKDEFVAAFFPSYDAALREHALGRFRDLLGAVAASPSMLHYLNNADSRASPANENFARELLELHTLGAGNYLNDRVDGWAAVPKGPDGVATGYIDEDVYEVARAFTGWTIGDGRWISDGETAPAHGLFHYVEGWHDPYQKRILGVEFEPHSAPLEDGDRVLDILATHPGTAAFVCEKIARRLLADDPDPALIGHLAQVFLDARDAPDQIAQVIRALVAHPAFDSPPQKLRRPFEALVALHRASGVKVVSTENSYHWQLSRAGWQQHTWPPPNGHPDRATDWSNGVTLVRMVEVLLSAHDDWFGTTLTRLSDRLPDSLRTYGDLTDHWTTALFGRPRPLPDLLAALGETASDGLPPDPDERHDLSALTLAFAALSPEFLYR